MCSEPGAGMQCREMGTRGQNTGHLEPGDGTQGVGHGGQEHGTLRARNWGVEQGTVRAWGLNEAFWKPGAERHSNIDSARGH